MCLSWRCCSSWSFRASSQSYLLYHIKSYDVIYLSIYLFIFIIVVPEVSVPVVNRAFISYEIICDIFIYLLIFIYHCLFTYLFLSLFIYLFIFIIVYLLIYIYYCGSWSFRASSQSCRLCRPAPVHTWVTSEKMRKYHIYYICLHFMYQLILHLSVCIALLLSSYLCMQ